MEFTKKILKESLEIKSEDKKTFSEVPQHIVISEEQLERLIDTIKSNEPKKDN
jgi:DNA-directed RNA polymerase subunit H (RpoH/RPB5)